MSEYQYYEFAVLDRPLSKVEQAELRSYSTRATITASSFSNTYHWGDLKGDPYEWMERYFDAHVYSSDMGYCRFILRVPKPLIAPHEATQATGFGRDRGTYGGSAFSIHDSGQYWLLDWSYTDEEGYDERFQSDEDGPGWMARLAPLRDEMLRGDRRPLYLGWLAALCSEELDDDDLEPPVPPGLQTLTAAQQALVEFLQLDPDLLAVAQSASEEDAGADLHTEMLEEWMRDLSPDQMRNVVRLVMTGAAHQAERGMHAQYASWQQQRNPARPGAGERRTVAQIEAGRSLAEQVRIERERIEQEEAHARRQAERARELADVAEYISHYLVVGECSFCSFVDTKDGPVRPGNFPTNIAFAGFGEEAATSDLEYLLLFSMEANCSAREREELVTPSTKRQMSEAECRRRKQRNHNERSKDILGT